MSALCEKLDLFVDGELSEAEAEAVRGHLARCGACAARLQEAVQLEMLSAEAFQGKEAPCAQAVPHATNNMVGLESPFSSPEENRAPAAATPRKRSWRSRYFQGMSAAAALATAAYVALPARMPPAHLWLAEAPTRKLEARLSVDQVDRHRPFEPMLSGGSTDEVLPVPLADLSRLDEKKDVLAIAAAYLIHGDAEQARARLEMAPSSPDRDNDLAVVLMQSGNSESLEQARRLLEGVLEREPRHTQARWNHALVLRDLGDKAAAAEAFEQIAASKEPGWSDEALRIARALRQ